jgi:hypothetical protein
MYKIFIRTTFRPVGRQGAGVHTTVVDFDSKEAAMEATSRINSIPSTDTLVHTIAYPLFA